MVVQSAAEEWKVPVQAPGMVSRCRWQQVPGHLPHTAEVPLNKVPNPYMLTTTTVDSFGDAFAHIQQLPHDSEGNIQSSRKEKNQCRYGTYLLCDAQAYL